MSPELVIGREGLRYPNKSHPSLSLRPCPACGETYRPRRDSQRYCSMACSHAPSPTCGRGHVMEGWNRIEGGGRVQCRECIGIRANAYHERKRLRQAPFTGHVTSPEKFMLKVQYDTNGGCWLFDSAKMGFGYGRLKFDGKSWPAHRLAWHLFRGPIPLELLVCHACDVPACVNPDHLFLGTQADNMQDMLRKGRAIWQQPKEIAA